MWNQVPDEVYSFTVILERKNKIMEAEVVPFSVGRQRPNDLEITWFVIVLLDTSVPHKLFIFWLAPVANEFGSRLWLETCSAQFTSPKRATGLSGLPSVVIENFMYIDQCDRKLK